jgi:hypothetical protein
MEFNWAGVVELADTLCSGRSGCTSVGVQIPPPAFFILHKKSEGASGMISTVKGHPNESRSEIAVIVAGKYAIPKAGPDSL